MKLGNRNILSLKETPIIQILLSAITGRTCFRNVQFVLRKTNYHLGFFFSQIVESKENTFFKNILIGSSKLF